MKKFLACGAIAALVIAFAAARMSYPHMAVVGPGDKSTLRDAPGPVSANGYENSVQTFFLTPEDGHQPVINAINAAQRTIDMTMFTFTDPAVVSALTSSQARGVQVRVILNQGSLQQSKNAATAQTLKTANVQVTPSSTGFSITHEKAMVIDGGTAVIMTMNMTNEASQTRDYGVIIQDPGVAVEMENVFNEDLQNAQSGGDATPSLSQSDLLWSPVDSLSKLTGLASSARQSLIAEVESFDDSSIEAAMAAAVTAGAAVRVVVPACVLGQNPYINYPLLAKLASDGAQVRVMPSPSSPNQPYMHAKIMVADGARAYLGSVNYSLNSTMHARELGVLLSDGASLTRLSQTFESDWNAAVPVPADPRSFQCPTSDPATGQTPFK